MKLRLLVLFVVLLIGCNEEPKPTPISTASTTFTYQIRLINSNTQLPIGNAEVTLYFGGEIAPETALTDDKGVAMLQVPQAYDGIGVDRNLFARGYHLKREIVSLRNNSRIHIVELMPLPTLTPPSLQALTPTLFASPAPLDTIIASTPVETRNDVILVPRINNKADIAFGLIQPDVIYVNNAGDNEDFYTFVVTQSTSIQITVNNQSIEELGSQMVLYKATVETQENLIGTSDSEWNVIAHDGSPSANFLQLPSNESDFLLLAPGRYLLRVYIEQPNPLATYSLHMSFGDG